MPSASRHLFSLGLFCAAGLATATALAAPMTLSFSGTIRHGYDNTGQFGAAGTDLSGRSVDLSYTVDGDWLNNQSYWQQNIALTETITIDGVSRQYDSVAGNHWLYTYISSDLTQYGSSYSHYYGYGYGYGYHYDQVYLDSSGYTSDGSYNYSYQNLYSFDNPFDLNTGGSWQYNSQQGDQGYGYFQTYDANWGTSLYFDNTVTRVSLTDRTGLAQAAAVPEPASLALVGLALAAALGVSGAVRRRFGQQAQVGMA